MKPDHSTLCNYYDNPARFEVYTQTMNGQEYKYHTFIDAMNADWSSLTLQSAGERIASNVEQSRPKALDTDSHLLPNSRSADVKDNSPSQEKVKAGEDESSQAPGERADTSPRDVLEAQETVAFMLFEAGDIINELGAQSFSNEESAIELATTIDAMFVMLDDGLYFEAMAVLDNDILQRTDGCANTGQADENDWVTSIEGQALVYPLVIETIELLENLI